MKHNNEEEAREVVARAEAKAEAKAESEAKAEAKAEAKGVVAKGVEEEDPTITDRSRNRIAHEIAIALESRRVNAGVVAAQTAERIAAFHVNHVDEDIRESNEIELTRLIAEERGFVSTK